VSGWGTNQRWRRQQPIQLHAVVPFVNRCVNESYELLLALLPTIEGDILTIVFNAKWR